MNNHDVHLDEMDDLTPEELEYLLEHSDEPDTHPVAVVFADLRSALQSVEAPAPGPAFAEFLGASASSVTSASSQEREVSRVAAVSSLRRHPSTTKRNRKARRSVAAIAATTTGKILLGTTAAAAAFGAAQATGVVDVTPNNPAIEVVSSAAADTLATPENQFRVDAADAGTLGVYVEDGQVRLADISSADGWNGRLKADSDSEVLISFENSDDGRQATVLLTIAQLDPERSELVDITSFVTVQVTQEDGTVSTSWFGSDGIALRNISEIAELVISPDLDTTLDLGLGDLGLGDLGLGDDEINVDGDVNIGPDVGVDARVQLDTDTRIDADVQIDTDTGVQISGDPNADLGIGLGTDAEVQLDTNGVQTQTDTNGVQTQTDTSANVDLGTGLSSDADVSVDADLDVDLGTDDGLDLNTDLDADLDVGLGTDDGLDLNTDLDTNLDVDLGGDSNADPDLDVDVDLTTDDGLDADLNLDLGSLFGN